MIVQGALDLGFVGLSEKFERRRMTGICVFHTLPYHPIIGSSNLDLHSATADDSTTAPCNSSEAPVGLTDQWAWLD